MRTQYRKQFNQPKPFQKRSVIETSGRLKVKKLTYEPTDMRVTGFGGGAIDKKFFEDDYVGRNGNITYSWGLFFVSLVLNRFQNDH